SCCCRPCASAAAPCSASPPTPPSRRTRGGAVTARPRPRWSRRARYWRPRRSRCRRGAGARESPPPRRSRAASPAAGSPTGRVPGGGRLAPGAGGVGSAGVPEADHRAQAGRAVPGGRPHARWRPGAGRRGGRAGRGARAQRAGAAMTALADFELPRALEASEPPEARGIPRDAVRMLVSRRATGEITHHPFTDLPSLLLPGDLVVVNTSATLPASVRAGPGLVMHFSTSLPDGSWLAELRAVRGHATQPYPGGSPGQELPLPGGAVVTLAERVTGRLWRVRLSTAVVPYLLRHGSFIHYSYV